MRLGPSLIAITCFLSMLLDFPLHSDDVARTSKLQREVDRAMGKLPGAFVIVGPSGAGRLRRLWHGACCFRGRSEYCRETGTSVARNTQHTGDFFVAYATQVFAHMLFADVSNRNVFALAIPNRHTEYALGEENPRRYDDLKSDIENPRTWLSICHTIGGLSSCSVQCQRIPAHCFSCGIENEP